MGQYIWRLSMLATQIMRFSLYEHLLPPGQLYHATEHLLPYLKRPTVLTVHDLIFERYPEHHTPRNRWFLKFAMPRFVRAADAIIAVSQHTKRDLVDLYDTPAEKIHVIYEGLDPAFTPAQPDEMRRVQQQYSPGEGAASRPYLLMVGTLEPRKNHAVAMQALVRLKAAGFSHRLLVVGGNGWLFEPVRQLVRDLDLDADVTFAGYAPFTDLPALYAGADCVLAPSLYEGFGLPVLEAMACAAPVVCSNASSLPEVAGDAALTVPPSDSAALAAAVGCVLSEPGLSAAMREKGLRWAKNFQWKKCAEETVGVYKALLESKPPDHSSHMPPP
jgi:glycosyltransferase involved in cell wall biosynthesis